MAAQINTMTLTEPAARFGQCCFNEAHFVVAAEPAIHRKKMTNLQIDDVLGFGVLLRGAATEYKAKLLGAKSPHDPTPMITDTAAAGEELGRQKAAAKTATDTAKRLNDTAEGAKNDQYSVLSNWCDQMAGTLGKTTPEGKRILAIRANLKGRGPNPTPPPSPAA